jgi:zinc protease
MRIRTYLRTYLILSLCALVSLPALADTNPAQEFILKNGMKIIVKEDHRAPTVAHMIWYKAGAMDEKNGYTGLAHALEHMMFKGTKKLKPGDFSAKVAALGGRENAFTTHDYTAYFQQISSSKLENVMELEADRMANLVFDQKEFGKEIRVVMEERRMRTDDQPAGLMSEALNATAFVEHPYHHPVIGWMHDLEAMTVQDAKSWYDHWYAPNNATMVVSGDVDPQKVYALAQKYFGKIKPKTLPVTRTQAEPKQQGAKRVIVKAPAENPYVVLAFKVPTMRDVEKDSDVYALQVLAAVLDGYDNARLNAKLVRTDKVANSVDAEYSPLARGPVLFTLDGMPVQGISTEMLEKLLRAEVDRIAKQGVSEQELTRVKTQLVAGQVYKRDSIFGQAMEIGVTEMSGISYTNIDRMIEKLKQVTPQQVQEVAQKYFGDDGMTVATLVPLPITSPKQPIPTGGMLH